MNKIILNDPDKLSSAKLTSLKMGVSPSGKIHVGTLVTCVNALAYMAQDGDSTMEITVHDLFSTFQMGKSFLPHKYVEDEFKCHDTMPQHTAEELRVFIEYMTQFFSIEPGRVKVGYMSDLTGTQDFRTSLNDILSNEDKRSVLVNVVKLSGDKTDRVPIHPVCPDCYYTSTKYAKFIPGNSELKTKCYNDGCDVGEYSVSILDPSQEVVLYYLLNLLRDVVPVEGSKVADAHFCGGDKLEKKGTKYDGRQLTILERGLEIMRLVTDDLPLMFIGAQITYRGNKLSKSERTRFTFEALQNRYGENWPQKLYQFTQNTWNKGSYDIKGSCISDMLRRIH